MSCVTGFVNCKAYSTVKVDQPFEAFLVVQGKVASLGSSKKIAEQAKSLEGDIVDLNGKCVLPGFIDSHLHIDELGMYLNSLDLRGTKSIGELQEKLQDFASNVTHLDLGTWLGPGTFQRKKMANQGRPGHSRK